MFQGKAIKKLHVLVRSLQTQVDKLQEELRNRDTPKRVSAEESLRRAEFKRRCDEYQLCHLCGRPLVEEDISEIENLPEFKHSCPVHGPMYIERW